MVFIPVTWGFTRNQKLKIDIGRKPFGAVIETIIWWLRKWNKCTPLVRNPDSEKLLEWILQTLYRHLSLFFNISCEDAFKYGVNIKH